MSLIILFLLLCYSKNEKKLIQDNIDYDYYQVVSSNSVFTISNKEGKYFTILKDISSYDIILICNKEPINYLFTIENDVPLETCYESNTIKFSYLNSTSTGERQEGYLITGVYIYRSNKILITLNDNDKLYRYSLVDLHFTEE